MKKMWLLAPLIIILLLIFLLPKQSNRISENTAHSPTPIPIKETTPSPVNFTAYFEIHTLGTKRIFTDSKYHNLSDDVYITPSNTNQIIVKGKNVTWSDFFATLPMKLEKDCLTTGTGQVFCTSEIRSLKFYVNDIEDPDVLDKEISPDDFLRVVYE